MLLNRLSLTNFRSYSRLDMDVPRRILLLVGGNAQGKTSLLEAVYYLATLTSFQASHDRQLIHFQAAQEALAVARITAEYERGGSDHRIEVRIIQEGTNGGSRVRKEVLLDGAKLSAQSALGSFTAVIFLPQMTRILEGGPEERRRYLNLALAQAVPGYARMLAEYSQILTQRNALLKQLNERGGDAAQLTYWDEMLTQRGAQLIFERISAVDQLEQQARRIHAQLTHDAEVLRFSYQPAYDPLPIPQGQFSLPLHTTVDRSKFSLEEIQKGFFARLAVLRREEISRGVTTVGPHRDELRISANGVDLGDYGSRGQVRTALLSLKLAETDWLRQRTGEQPILLLDEITAELDLQRRADLLSYLENCDQSLVTTTDLSLFEESFVRRHTVWQVTAGRVEPAIV